MNVLNVSQLYNSGGSDGKFCVKCILLQFLKLSTNIWIFLKTHRHPCLICCWWVWRWGWLTLLCTLCQFVCLGLWLSNSCSCSTHVQPQNANILKCESGAEFQSEFHVLWVSPHFVGPVHPQPWRCRSQMSCAHSPVCSVWWFYEVSNLLELMWGSGLAGSLSALWLLCRDVRSSHPVSVEKCGGLGIGLGPLDFASYSWALKWLWGVFERERTMSVMTVLAWIWPPSEKYGTSGEVGRTGFFCRNVKLDFIPTEFAEMTK